MGERFISVSGLPFVSQLSLTPIVIASVFMLIEVCLLVAYVNSYIKHYDDTFMYADKTYMDVAVLDFRLN